MSISLVEDTVFYARKIHVRTAKIQRRPLPIVWIEESAEMDEAQKEKLDSLLFKYIRLMKGMAGVAVAIGLVALTVGIHFFYEMRKSASRQITA